MQSPVHAALWSRFPTSTPRLEGERASLRGYLLSDQEAIFAASRTTDIPHVGPEVADEGTGGVIRYITANAARPAHQQGYSWTIVDNESGAAAGHIGVWFGNIVHGRAIVGYWVLPEYRRRGLAGESLMLVTDFLLGLPGVTRIELHIETANAASIRVAEKVGYTLEATLARWQIIDGRTVDMHMYVVLPGIDYDLVTLRQPAPVSQRQTTAP